MAIDPLRTTGGRIIQRRDRPTAARPDAPGGDAPSPAEPARTPVVAFAAAAAGAGEAKAPDGLNVRKALVLSRIQKDYYSQAHVRERVIESLLQFLDEE